MAKLIVNCTRGREDPERATLAFVVGNVAASADQDAVVLLTIDGVWLATKGYADDIHKEGFQPLRDVIQAFVANGGQIWACGACAIPRGINDAQLIEGAKIVTAAQEWSALRAARPRWISKEHGWRGPIAGNHQPLGAGETLPGRAIAE